MSTSNSGDLHVASPLPSAGRSARASDRATPPRDVGARTAAALIGCMALLAGCSASTPAASPPQSPPSAQVEPSQPAGPPTSPYTGLPGGVGKPVVVVKLDNTPSAQPHRALSRADIVYVEPVEGGLTRLAAVYSSRMPEAVGPVRSARIGDIEVFEPYGDIAFVFSGAQTRLRPKIRAAGWTPVSEDFDSPGFHREYATGRYSPYNLMAEPRHILATSGATATSHDMGMVFDDQAPAGGKQARQVTAKWLSASMQFRWNAKKDAYDVWIDGRQARDTEKPGVQRASTVVIQYVKEVDSGYGDRFGGRTPLTVTTGSGKGLVLRDGRAHRITWKRQSSAEPTAFLGADGESIAFDPGQVWIVLKDRTRKVSVQ